MFMLHDMLTSSSNKPEEIAAVAGGGGEGGTEEVENDEIIAAANAAVANAVSAPLEDEEESESESESEEESEEDDLEDVEVDEEEEEEESNDVAEVEMEDNEEDEEEEGEEMEEEEEEEEDDESASSDEDDDDDESYSTSSSYSGSESASESSSSSSSEDIKQATTSERRSLLLLAAEHDRVDILKAILSSTEERGESPSHLLNDAEYYKNNVPALHVAIANGSTHAASCLLRMGADPSIKPVLEGEEEKVVERKKFGGRSAWEIAFGRTTTTTSEEHHDENEEKEEKEEEKKGWFSWGRAPSSPTPNTASSPQKSTTYIPPLNTIPPSKLEGIKHAFTAEALRAIGSDEDLRLLQLLRSGMDVKSEVGGRDLKKWCEELGANKCLSMLQREFYVQNEEAEVEENENDENEKEENDDAEQKQKNRSLENSKFTEEEEEEKSQNSDTSQPSQAAKMNAESKDQESTTSTPTPSKTPPETQSNLPSLSTLQTQITESETLSSALSTILDNLAEEVSICQSILLDNSSAASTGLASHVRHVKSNINQQKEDIVKWSRHLEKHTGEYNYLWYGVLDKDMRREILEGEVGSLFLDEFNSDSVAKNGKKKEEEEEKLTEEEMEKRREELMNQLAVCENKVRKLRTSIASLAEENAKSLEQVEQRGLTGAIQLARTLREELRELDYELNAIQASNASCVTKINIMKRRLKEKEALEGGGKHNKKKKRREVKSRGLNLDGAGDGQSNGETREINGYHEQSPPPQQQQQQEQQHAPENSKGQEVDNAAKEEIVDHAAVDEKKEDEDEELTPLMNRNHHLASSSAWLVPVGALLHMNNEEEEKDGYTKKEDEDEESEGDEDDGDYEGEDGDDYSEDDEDYSEEEYTDEEDDEYYSDEEEEPRSTTRSLLSPSIKIQSGESTAIILRNPESNGYLSIDIWDLIRRIIGIGRDVASRSVQSFREDTAHVMTV